jgi:Protein of unknown function (DUF2829)
MKFGEALESLKEGNRVGRKAWNANNAYIKLFGSHKEQIAWASDHHPEQHYHPSHEDLLAEDWEKR